MCGITGFISKDWDKNVLTTMTDRLAHRGPDAAGYFFDPENGIGLGHRRLSILDLSTAANQPFVSGNGRFQMIYNGEVYNFKEVAEKYGITTRTNSDTEVILESFVQSGIKAIADLNGMFSLAIWDMQEKKLFLVRDRVGVKPLYYYLDNNNFAFASELKALFTLPVSKLICPDAIYDFLHLGYISGEKTIYKQFNKLLPGHYAMINKEGIRIESYWSLEDRLEKNTVDNEFEAKKVLKDLVTSSVQYNMISDVPLGVFLSGGVDSSLVAAVAQQVSPLPVKTFSIAFSDKKFNEAPYARQVAEHIQSDHEEFTVTEQEGLELAETLLDTYDEPYADSSAIPTMIVSKLARQKVTVALSGDGGDELFMGYGFYYWARRLQNPLLSAFRKPVAMALAATGKSRLQRAGKMFEYPSARRKSHIFSQEQYYFTEEETDELVIPRGMITIEEELKSTIRKFSWAEEQSFFDIKNYLPEELLVKTDRASMKYSLEVRVPLLDHRLIEFAINLAPSLKMKDKTGKYLLKEVLYDYVPREFFDRPKWGFAVPLSSWLKNDLSYLFDKYLSRKIVEECNLVKADVVEEIKLSFFGGSDYLYTRLWALIILHKWYKEKHC